jgi:hypothetical protein
MNLLPWLLAALLALPGCSEAPAGKLPVKAAPLEMKTPVPRAWRFDSGELLVIDVPVHATSKYVETQKCYLWRDAEFRTASLQCPNDASQVNLAGPPPEADRY